MSEKKRIPLRISASISGAAAWAEDDFRSIMGDQVSSPNVFINIKNGRYVPKRLDDAMEQNMGNVY